MGGGIIATAPCFRRIGEIHSYNMPMLSTRRAFRLLLLLHAGRQAAAGRGGRSQPGEGGGRSQGRARADGTRCAPSWSATRAAATSSTKELEESEKSVGSARGELDQLRRERAEQTARRAELADQRRERGGGLARERAALAGQIRAAQMIGQDEPLKLLLNQRDPAQAGRVFTYYQYFGRARAGQIASINAHLGEIAALDTALAEQEARLAALEEQRSAASCRSSRRRANAAAARSSRSTSNPRTARRSWSGSRSRRAGSRSWCASCARRSSASRNSRPTARTRSRSCAASSPGPRAASSSRAFGQTRAGGVKWDGVLVSAAQGSPVRAVYHGRVVYADWLSGLGLLTIIDHGDGYLVLYGHNERLYKEVGERVTAGDTIASVGRLRGARPPRPCTSKSARPAGRSTPGPGSRTAAP